MKWKIAILTHLGLKEGEVPTEEQLNEKFDELITDHAALKTEREGLTEENQKIETEKAELEKLKPMAEVGETYLKDMREKAESLYKLLKGDGASEKMVELIRKADIEQVKTYVEDFGKEVEEKIPAICSECGKPTKVSRRSSKEVLDDKKKRTDRSSYQTS